MPEADTETRPVLIMPDFDRADAAFGASLQQYPGSPRREDWRHTVPAEFRDGNGKYHRIVGALLYEGGLMADYGLTIKPGIDSGKVHVAINAWLKSFEPKHEHKTAVVAWALSEWFDLAEPEPKSAA